jgi:hypothetical protein
VKQKSKYCKTCQRKTLHVHPDNGITSGDLIGWTFATIFSCGLALLVFPFWLFFGVISELNESYACQICGSD